MVARVRTAVVLPAPLGPSRPSTLPASTARSMPSSAPTGPKRLTSPWAAIAGSAIVGAVRYRFRPDELGHRPDLHAPAQPEGRTTVRQRRCPIHVLGCHH